MNSSMMLIIFLIIYNYSGICGSTNDCTRGHDKCWFPDRCRYPKFAENLTTTVTYTGRPCKNWMHVTGYRHVPDIDDQNHNFCRNPNGQDIPWCYVNEGSLISEACYEDEIHCGLNTIPSLDDQLLKINSVLDNAGLGNGQFYASSGISVTELVGAYDSDSIAFYKDQTEDQCSKLCSARKLCQVAAFTISGGICELKDDFPRDIIVDKPMGAMLPEKLLLPTVAFTFNATAECDVPHDLHVWIKTFEETNTDVYKLPPEVIKSVSLLRGLPSHKSTKPIWAGINLEYCPQRDKLCSEHIFHDERICFSEKYASFYAYNACGDRYMSNFNLSASCSNDGFNRIEFYCCLHQNDFTIDVLTDIESIFEQKSDYKFKKLNYRETGNMSVYGNIEINKFIEKKWELPNTRRQLRGKQLIFYQPWKLWVPDFTIFGYPNSQVVAYEADTNKISVQCCDFNGQLTMIVRNFTAKVRCHKLEHHILCPILTGPVLYKGPIVRYSVNTNVSAHNKATNGWVFETVSQNVKCAETIFYKIIPTGKPPS